MKQQNQKKNQIQQKEKSNIENKIEELIIKIRDFILKNKMIFGISSFVVVVIISLLIYYNYNRNLAEENASKIYDTALSYIQSLQYITNEQDRQNYYNQQLNNIESIIQVYPDTLAAVRARLFMGRLYLEESIRKTDEGEDQINKAISYYSSAYEIAKDPFYKALAIIGRAQSYEQKKEYVNAISDYSNIIVKYNNFGFTPLAYMGIARCKEFDNDVDTALNYYAIVADKYKDSLWARLARGKIFYYTEENNK